MLSDEGKIVWSICNMMVLLSGVMSTVEIDSGDGGKYIDAPVMSGFHMTWWFAITLAYTAGVLLTMFVMGGKDELARKV
jgi:low affinity Fe/Cu permease